MDKMEKKMKIEYKSIDELKPYENNPRNNEKAVKYVANSIKQFGFKVPLVIESDGTIITGHTRYQACKELGITEVPCIIADELTDKQIKAFRIADNKTNDMAEWNDDLLAIELKDVLDDIDMTDFGFGEFELSILTEDMEPEEYDDDLIKEYTDTADDFLTNKRIIITYKTPEETEFLKNLIKEDEEELNVVYKVEKIMERFDE